MEKFPDLYYVIKMITNKQKTNKVMTKVQKLNENHAIVSFDKSVEKFSMQNYVKALQSKGFKITNKYQKGSEVFVEMKK